MKTKKRFILVLAITAGTLLAIFFVKNLVVSQQAKDGSSALKCNNGNPARAALFVSKDPVLGKLAEYESYCRGEVTNTMMLFTAMPATENEAISLSQDTAKRLKEFAKYNITPFILFEPPVTPTIIDELNGGNYDEVLAKYYRSLKDLKVTDSQMGTWVLFPEANTPTWHNTTPETYRSNVTRLAKLQKQFFPFSNISILLNSRTYESSDVNWNGGQLKDLKPYIANLPKGLINSFGYQGFPSVSEADASHRYSQMDAKDFLPAKIATDAAKTLGLKNIWINTGTFSRIYTNDTKAQVTVSSSQRANTLNTIREQAQLIKAAGYDVTISLFAKNKSRESEHIDWSYPLVTQDIPTNNDQTLKLFIKGLRDKNIEFSFYDSK